MKPIVKLRNFMWTKLAPSVASNPFWETIGDVDLMQNLKLLDEQFALVAPQSAPPGSSRSRSPESPTEKEKVKKISVIDKKRAYNIGIVLARFKCQVSDIVKAVVENNQKILDLNFLIFLRANCPTKEDLDLLKPYLESSAKYEMLERSDQLLCALIPIPRIDKRIDCIITQLMFPERQKNLYDQAYALECGCESFEGPVVKKILGLVRSVGNYLNKDSYRGKAIGFALSSLLLVRINT